MQAEENPERLSLFRRCGACLLERTPRRGHELPWCCLREIGQLLSPVHEYTSTAPAAGVESRRQDLVCRPVTKRCVRIPAPRVRCQLQRNFQPLGGFERGALPPRPFSQGEHCAPLLLKHDRAFSSFRSLGVKRPPFTRPRNPSPRVQK